MTGIISELYRWSVYRILVHRAQHYKPILRLRRYDSCASHVPERFRSVRTMYVPQDTTLPDYRVHVPVQTRKVVNDSTLKTLQTRLNQVVLLGCITIHVGSLGRDRAELHTQRVPADKYGASTRYKICIVTFSK